MEPVSVIITTFNEAAHIDAAIDSVLWADEILVVDSFSTDTTVDIASSKGATIIQREYSGPSDQKNFAIKQAKHNWILILDADERCTIELKNEIQKLLQKSDLKNGYSILRDNYFLGKRIHYSGWQYDRVTRLIKKGVARYNDVQVHEKMLVDGQVGTLENRLLHFTCHDLDHFLDRQRRYARWGAQDKANNKIPSAFWLLLIKPIWKFKQYYFLRLGILDGWRGLVISATAAWTVFLRGVYLLNPSKN